MKNNEENNFSCHIFTRTFRSIRGLNQYQRTCVIKNSNRKASSAEADPPDAPTIPHKNFETNNKFYRKVAFLMYTEMVNFRPQS